MKLSIPHRLFLAGLALASAATAAVARDGVTAIPQGARVAIIGDSITEQKLYSKFIETYLLACAGRADIKCMQFGWGGERAVGWVTRMANDTSIFRPDVATFCYGMNDGSYQPYQPAIGAEYEKNMRIILTEMPKLGTKVIVAGSPGAVDFDFFKRNGLAAAVYNDNLAHLRDIDKKLATAHNQRFADVHDTMVDAMTKAKAALGKEYDVCGKDGFHPGPNGHLLMAMAFLKGLGCDGNIGEITLNMAGNPTVSDGHKLVSGSAGTAEIDSMNWPFVFDGDAKSSGGTRSITPHCSFNQDLNRLTLKVEGLKAKQARVTWGSESKEFTSEQLSAGINLAAEFEKTPFDAAFGGLIAAVGTKQAYETPLIKDIVNKFRSFEAEAKEDAEVAAAVSTLKRKLFAKQEKLDKAVHAKLVPVRHTVKVVEL